MDYEKLVDEILSLLIVDNLVIVVELVCLFEKICGYGYVKYVNVVVVKK